MANALMTIAQALEADVRDVCEWDSTVDVFFGNPRTQPTSRTYAIIVPPKLPRQKGSPTDDHYRTRWKIKVRLDDPDSSIIRLNLRTEIWLKLRAKLTPRPEDNAGSSAYHGGYGCIVEDGDLEDMVSGEEPDYDLSLDFETTIKLTRGVTNIT